MGSKARFLRRDALEIGSFEEVCGSIRGLVDGKDDAAGEVYFVEVHNAQSHFHKRTDEFYYILGGEGTMRLDGETVELHQGVLVYIPRGVVHQAEPKQGGTLNALVVAIPRGLSDDIYDPAGAQLSME